MNSTSSVRIAERAATSFRLPQCLHNTSTFGRAFTTTPSKPLQTTADESTAIPRWQQTPKAMAMPVRTRQRNQASAFKINSDPEKLDAALKRMIGNGAPSMLPEEIKWLAVTHKSFDHGRRGNNDRLSYLGKRIVDLQCSLALMQAPTTGLQGSSHPALKGLENVTAFSKQRVLDKSRIAQLAQGYGLAGVMRWTPKKADNLQGSGIDTVLAHTLYSIIGALSLQRGGAVATQVVRERILAPLGLRR